MSATHNTQSTAAAGPVLYVALELGWNSWKLAFTTGMGQKPRMRTVTGRNTGVLLAEIKKAKRRFGLSEETTVLSCYEAGRDGFWLHRALLASGVHNQVVDSASIEVNRRKRRAKSDGLDATKLVEMLIRWHNGERKVWRVVNVAVGRRRRPAATASGVDGAEGRTHIARKSDQGATGLGGYEHHRDREASSAARKAPEAV